MRESGLVSIGPNLEKSCAGISGMPAPARPRRGGCRARTAQERHDVVLGDAAFLAGARHLGEIDAHLARDAAHARSGVHAGEVRRLRAGGTPAWTGSGRRPASGAAAGAGEWAVRAAARSGSCCASSDGGCCIAPSSWPRSRIGGLLLTRSPTLTRTSRIWPAEGAGTSIVALSDSSVISGSSALTGSPGLDEDVDDRHVLEVADVGDRTSVAARRSCPMDVPSRPLAGFGLSGSMSYRLMASATVAARHGPVVGQRLQRRDRDVVPVHLEECAQLARGNPSGRSRRCRAPGSGRHPRRGSGRRTSSCSRSRRSPGRRRPPRQVST